MIHKNIFHQDMEDNKWGLFVHWSIRKWSCAKRRILCCIIT